MGNYIIGTAKTDITFAKKGIVLQGFALKGQITKNKDEKKNIKLNLFSRAFVVKEIGAEGKNIAIVIADIWSCTPPIKEQVLNHLKTIFSNYGKPLPYTEKNLQISGTHTHGGAAGFTKYGMYGMNVLDANVDKELIIGNIEKIASGIASSIFKAYINSKEGDILVCSKKNNATNVYTYNRSKIAFNNNTNSENVESIDNTMLVLKFIVNEKPIGMINWFPIHPTSEGDKNMKISGDNKGYAAKFFEEFINPKGEDLFVAAFANSNCGDVSGQKKDNNKTENAKTLGEKQYLQAKTLYTNEEFSTLSGPLNFEFKEVDMSCVKINEKRITWLPALGLSTSVGSQEDGETNLALRILLLKEGLPRHKIPFLQIFGSFILRLFRVGYLKLSKSNINQKLFIDPENKNGHKQKPIVVYAHEDNNVLPYKVPLQILTIGSFVSLGIPAEITTMAGRRLKKAILSKLKVADFNIALSTYSNAYSSYITTEEEYAMQHYEGASTLYGPNTLKAYIYYFEKMTTNLNNPLTA